MNYPNFSFEKKLWKKGFKLVAGVDEVGRGSVAGPVVAGCVVFDRQTKSADGVVIDDCKKLKSRQRGMVGEWIRENAVSWGTGEVSAVVINKIGMAKATQKAFRRAIENASKRLGRRIDFLLIDAFFVPYVRGLPRVPKSSSKQLAIINGDEKSISIAAASIAAKVHRDKLMRSLSRRPRYKRYRWGRNKGYGTKAHQEAIKKYGVTRYHRKSFVKAFI